VAKGREVFLAANPDWPWTCFFCGEEVWSREDLQVHHMDEIDFHNDIGNLFAVHPGCHKKWHAALKRIRLKAFRARAALELPETAL